MSLPVLFLSLTAIALANPQVPRGTTGVFPSQGSAGVITPTWQITISTATIATSTTTHGWTVSLTTAPNGMTTFHVGVPSTATIATGYRVAYQNGGSTNPYAIFDVVAAPTGPNAPTNLTANGVTSTGATLSWTAPAGSGLTYSVYEGQTSGNEGTTPIASGLTATTYPVTGLVGGSNYVFTVKAVNSSGTSPASNEIGIYTPASPPVLSATASGTTASLSWTFNTAADSLYYEVWRSDDGGNTFNKIADHVDDYTDTGLTLGATYIYYVVAHFYSTSESHTPMQLTSNAVAVTAQLAAPIDLAVYATGSGKITLYWSGVPDATGYNVYRGTAAGGEDYANPVNGATPVTTLDTGPGVTNIYQFSDTGLTDGTQYFYTVEAVNGTAKSGPSDEDSDTPSPTAIPWDTGNPATITSLIRQNEADQTGLNFSLSYCSLRVMGPDGVIYQEGVSSALPPDGSIDAVNGTMTLGNIVSPVGHFLQEANSSTSGPTPIASKLLYGGGMRRVTSKLIGASGTGFTGVSGTVYLPSTADTSYMSIAASSALSGREGPNTYVGMTGGGVEVDAGIQFVPNTYPVGTNLPNRWEGYLRVSDGPSNNTQQINNRFRVMGDHYNYIDADSQIGNDADLKFTLNSHDETCGLIVFGYDHGGLYFAKWYVGALTSAKLTHLNNHPVQMKREFSLDQDIQKGLSYTPFTNAISQLIIHSDGTRETATTVGYVPTGSYMDDIGWQSGSLYQNATLLDWTGDLVSEIYLSAAGSGNIVSVNPIGGDAENETVSIDHF